MEEIPQIPRFKEIESLFELSISDLKNVEFLNNVDIFIDQDDSLNSILKIDSVDINENNIIINNKNKFENILIYLKNFFNKIKEVLHP